NAWFLQYAPQKFREKRIETTKDVAAMFQRTDNLRQITTLELSNRPGILPALRMSTAPPLARDRLIGLAGVSKTLVARLEKNQLPPKMPKPALEAELQKIAALIMRLADVDIFPWLEDRNRKPTRDEVYRAATIVADRLCGALT